MKNPKKTIESSQTKPEISDSKIQQMSLLFVHQSAELYGSDRTFVQSIKSCRKTYPKCKITVLLPFNGPLIKHIKPFANQIVIDDLIILRKSTILRKIVYKPFNFFQRIFKATKLINGHDLTYINTTVVLDFILASRFSKKPCIIHAHELPTRFIKIILNLILYLSKGILIFNSNATRLAYSTVKYRRNYVIPNGTTIHHYKPVNIAPPLKILLIGRFNKWKGHTLLLQALSVLPDEKKSAIQVRFLGGVFKGQDHLKRSIQDSTIRLGLSDQVKTYNFVNDPTAFYHWANLIVVPSILPEPFGLVAIEAMGHSRPVIAANNGGLIDIVEDNITGFLFTPGDAQDLSQKLLNYIDNPGLIITHGKQGHSVFLKHFHEDRYLKGIGQALARTIQSNQ